MNPDAELSQSSYVMADKALLVLLGEGRCVAVLVGLPGSQNLID